MASTTPNHVELVRKRIQFDKKKIEDGSLTKITVESFNLKDFWTQFDATVQVLSNEVTKIGFMCGQKPYPRSGVINNMMANLLQCYNTMRDLYCMLTEEIGQTLYKLITSAVVSIMSSLQNFVCSLNDLTEKGAKGRLLDTGNFWEACKAVQKLPRDNFEASIELIDSEESLASDALEELNTTIEEDQDGEDSREEMWSDEERDLAKRAVGLVKVTLTCLQRLKRTVKEKGSCEPPELCLRLDITNKAAQRVSPALDDFVTELYHPIHFPTALENAGKLAEVLRDLVSNIADYDTVAGKDIVKKLLIFINHNHAKVDPCSGNPVSNFNHLSLNT